MPRAGRIPHTVHLPMHHPQSWVLSVLGRQGTGPVALHALLLGTGGEGFWFSERDYRGEHMQIPSKFSWFDTLIYRLTARRWNKLISSVLSWHYSQRTEETARLSSEQLHILASEFDPTQRPAYHNHQRL